MGLFNVGTFPLRMSSAIKPCRIVSECKHLNDLLNSYFNGVLVLAAWHRLLQRPACFLALIIAAAACCCSCCCPPLLPPGWCVDPAPASGCECPAGCQGTGTHPGPLTAQGGAGTALTARNRRLLSNRDCHELFINCSAVVVETSRCGCGLLHLEECQ